jgi:hypothetical protein
MIATPAGPKSGHWARGAARARARTFTLRRPERTSFAPTRVTSLLQPTVFLLVEAKKSQDKGERPRSSIIGPWDLSGE